MVPCSMSLQASDYFVVYVLKAIFPLFRFSSGQVGDCISAPSILATLLKQNGIQINSLQNQVLVAIELLGF